MKAIHRTATNTVLTFVRDDLPPGFTPPIGCKVLDPAALPSGWSMESPSAEKEERMLLDARREELLPFYANLKDPTFTMTAAQLNKAVKWLLLQALRG
jgi:hypothetical protein